MSRFIDLRCIIAVSLVATCVGIGSSTAASTPGARSTVQGVLTLEAGLSHGYLPVEESKELHSRIRVEAQPNRSEERAPLNLAVVVDRSGSMRGGRLTQAKRAAHELVDRLAENDRLAIVEYGSTVEVAAESRPASERHRSRFHDAISGIRTDGRTNLAGGYERAVSIVAEHSTEETVDRVILLSDGQANIGARNPGALGELAEAALERGASTSTMGIGLGYDESIMTSMAKSGAGNHYFIEDESKLASMFAREFDHLASVVARDAYLVLELGDGIELTDVHGFSHRRSSGNVVIDLGAFHGRQQRDVLVDLASAAGPEGGRPILDVNLHFDDVTGSSERAVTHQAALEAVGTSDSEKLARVDDWVMERVEQILYADSVERATDAYDRGDDKKAREILEEQKDRLDEAADKSVLSEKKVRQKKRELEEKESTMSRAPSEGASGERLKKKSAGEALDVMQDSSAF